MKTKRTIADIPANRRACYEWKPVDIQGHGAYPAEGAVVCVSVPFECPPEHRAIARFTDGQFILVNSDVVLKGVTFWCHAPMTPEDLDAEAAEEKKQSTAEPDLFGTAQ